MHSQNAKVNYKGPSLGSSAAPKVMDMGKDTGKDATNVIKVWGCNPETYSPNADNHSRNKGKGGGYKK